MTNPGNALVIERRVRATIQATMPDPGNGARFRELCLIQATMTNPGNTLVNERRDEGHERDESKPEQIRVGNPGRERETREVYEYS